MTASTEALIVRGKSLIIGQYSKATRSACICKSWFARSIAPSNASNNVHSKNPSGNGLEMLPSGQSSECKLAATGDCGACKYAMNSGSSH